jgi:uncharacterized protein YecT (DUF1311 family)
VIRRLAATAFALLALASAPAVASGAGVSVAATDGRPLPCDGRTTIGLVGCRDRRTLAVDRRIDGVAVQIRAARDAVASRRFDAAQRAWLAYRRAECRSAADIHQGGTLGTVDAAACRLDLSRARLAALRARLRALATP